MSTIKLTINHQPLAVRGGFTLIELLVVTAIILVIIGAVSNLFFSSLRGSTRTALMNEVKQNGDYALSIMERMIKNAVMISSAETYCDGTSKDYITISNPDSGQTTFQCPSGSEVQIASNSATTTGYLTSDKVRVTDCSFSCVKSGTTAGAIVKISFTVQQAVTTPGITLKPEENVSLKYETSIIVRNTAF